MDEDLYDDFLDLGKRLWSDSLSDLEAETAPSAEETQANRARFCTEVRQVFGRRKVRVVKRR